MTGRKQGVIDTLRHFLRFRNKLEELIVCVSSLDDTQINNNILKTHDMTLPSQLFKCSVKISPQFTLYLFVLSV